MTDYQIFFLISLLVNIILSVLLFQATRTQNARQAGTIKIFTNPQDKKIYSLELNVEPEDLDDRQYVIFKIDNAPTS